MLNFTGQQIRMWKKFLAIECHREIVSFIVTDVFFAARQCSLSVQSRVLLLGSSYTGLS